MDREIDQMVLGTACCMTEGTELIRSPLWVERTILELFGNERYGFLAVNLIKRISDVEAQLRILRIGFSFQGGARESDIFARGCQSASLQLQCVCDR